MWSARAYAVNGVFCEFSAFNQRGDGFVDFRERKNGYGHGTSKLANGGGVDQVFSHSLSFVQMDLTL